MKKLKVYLDTSVISFALAEDSQEYRKATLSFLHMWKHSFATFISPIALFEIDKTTDPELRAELHKVIEIYEIPEIGLDESIQKDMEILKNIYVEKLIIPPKKIEDAYHIAIASLMEFDILLSWNFKHLANVKKNILINSVNREYGLLKELRIVTPLEVLDESY